jgi:hypothetical protein
MRSPTKLSLAKSGLLLIAMLPIQLGIEFTIAYFSPRVESQLVFGGPNGEFRLAPVSYLLVDVPLVPFTRYLLVVTSIAFFLGLTLLVVEAVRKLFGLWRPPSNKSLQPTAGRSDA